MVCFSFIIISSTHTYILYTYRFINDYPLYQCVYASTDQVNEDPLLETSNSSLNLSDIMISPIPPPPAFLVETPPTCENISSGMFQFYNHK